MHATTIMKTLYEALAGLFRALSGVLRWPGGRRGRRTGAEPAGTVPPELPADDLHLDALAREFPRELFAQLLLELPHYRRLMVESFASGNYRTLRDSVHQILGAAAYCGADGLEQGLRQLRLALKTDDGGIVEHYFRRAIQAIDDTLHDSGYHRPPE